VSRFTAASRQLEPIYWPTPRALLNPGLCRHRNSKGYDVAMRWRAKFSHISPVWYQIRWNGTDFTLSGQHDVDAGWMARLKLPAEPVRFVVVSIMVHDGFLNYLML